MGLLLLSTLALAPRLHRATALLAGDSEILTCYADIEVMPPSSSVVNLGVRRCTHNWVTETHKMRPGRTVRLPVTTRKAKDDHQAVA